MIIEVDKSFKKDFKKLKNPVLEKRVIEKLDLLEKVSNIFNAPNVKVMKGFNDFYRIRVGDYRIGLKVDGLRYCRSFKN